MKGFTKLALQGLLVTSGVSALTMGLAAPAYAQTTTGSVSGTVTDSSGNPVAGATVTAVNTNTNQTSSTVSGPSGTYFLQGLRPAPYTISTTIEGKSIEQKMIVSIGQADTLDLTPTMETAAAPSDDTGDAIVVTGNRLVETRTSEVATNVSQQQIRSLPQTDRNFLSFAALAPGVRYNDSETNKGISSGASTASQVNVFVDGVSLKNQLREGGVAGQQNSRGNPFGQTAVQEFRVLTQNYKAEYEQAGAAIITAVTKSGTNEFHGEIFGQYTDRKLSMTDIFVKRKGDPKPAFERKQYGASLGGPIIKDRLFFFIAYEGNDQDRAFNVDAGGNATSQASFEASSGRKLSEFEGAYVSPFRGDFYFGKLTLQGDDRNLFDLSFSRRDETDIQNFGGTTSYEAAENKRNRVDTALFKYTHTGDTFTNEFSASLLTYIFNPVSLNPDLPSYEYAGVMTFGGKDSSRRETQKSHTLRNDFTYTGFNDHAIKLGARVQMTDIVFDNQSYVQPRYTYLLEPVNNLNFSFPAEARLGLGNSRIAASNTQIGFFIQDDWKIGDKLELNLGFVDKA